jgi:signal transduction histidine kinase
MRNLAPVRWLQEHPFGADALLGVLIFALALPGMWLRDTNVDINFRDPDALGVLLVIAATLPLAWRRKNPVAVMWAVGVSATLIEALGYTTGAGGVGAIIALYTIAAHCDRRRSIIALCLTGVALLVIFLTARWDVTVPSIGGNVVIFLTAWVLGDNLQNRRHYLASVEERAARLERDQQDLARRAREDERSRIARELHDVVAHNVSVMVVQAGAARRVLDRNPEQATESLEAIEATGRLALDELRRLLGVLRPDDAASDARSPQPSISHVDALVRQMRDAGLDVTLEIEGDPRSLPPALDLSAYRIVQEALTNTLKHAGPTPKACVHVRYADDAVDVEVTDDGRGLAQELEMGTAANGGHGLVGMRERVALFGGTLHAGARSGGGYRVRAHIPLTGIPVA